MFGSRSSHIQKKTTPQVPDGVRVYAVGDIHGRADLLDQALNRIDADLDKNPIFHSLEVFLGDYVDRGPNSRQVIDRLLTRGASRKTIFLKGNHEIYLADFVNNPTVLHEWQRLGGLATLTSYGIVASVKTDEASQVRLSAAFDRAFPQSHRQFLRDLKLSFTCGDFLFVHAGVRPGISLEMQHEDDLLWIRDDFLLSEENFSKYVIYGHTPVAQPDIRPNRMNIDTGAYATGRLTCLKLEGNSIDFV